MPNLSVNLVDTWPTYFEVGKLYRTRVATYVHTAGYGGYEQKYQDSFGGEVAMPANSIFMVLDRIQRPDWHSYEIKILVGERVCYIWFASEWNPEQYVEKVV